MSFISSTAEKVLVISVVALLALSMTFGGLWWYRGTVIDKQDAEIAQQKEQLKLFEKDKEAQEAADSQLQADKDKIAKERNKYKAQLDEALKNQACADAPLPDDAKRVLKELYGGKGS